MRIDIDSLLIPDDFELSGPELTGKSLFREQSTFYWLTHKASRWFTEIFVLAGWTQAEMQQQVDMSAQTGRDRIANGAPV